MDAKMIRTLVAQALDCGEHLVGVIVGEGMVLVAVPKAVSVESRRHLEERLYNQYRSLRIKFPIVRFV